MKTPRPWIHIPHHRLKEGGVFMVTAATYHRELYFVAEEHLKALTQGLRKYAQKHRWALQAWAVFPNHYHFIGVAPDADAVGLSRMIRELHSRSARWLNRIVGSPGRKVWHNYWERQIRTESDYLARLHYVHRNAVKHGLVDDASEYPWCSAAWFESSSSSEWREKVYDQPFGDLGEEF